MSKIKLIAIIGRSASGKDSLVQATLNAHPNLHKITHYTTRPPRPNEANEVDYFFISEEEMNNLKKSMFSTTCFNNWYYAIGKNSFDKNKINIGVFNPIELKYLIDFYPNSFEFHIIETRATEEDRYYRSLRRLDSFFDKEGLMEMCRRNQADEIDFKNIENIPRKILFTSYCEGSAEYNLAYMNGVIDTLDSLV